MTSVSAGEAVAESGGAADCRGRSIVIYGMNYSPEPIGVGRYTGDLGAFLAREGCEVAVVTAVPHYPGWAVRDNYRNTFQSEQSDRTKVIRCPLLLRSDMRGIWRVLAPLSFMVSSSFAAFWTILSRKPDTVLCVEPTLLSAPIALLAAKIVGARTVLHVQDLEMDAAFAVGHVGGGLLKRLACCYDCTVTSWFDFVITISNAMRRGLEAKHIPNERIGLIRNWVDLSKIRELDGPNAFRAELGLAENDFVVQYAGNIGAKQALDVLLDAAVRLENAPGIVFIVAGEGPERARLVARYGHLKNVRFIGLQPEERLCELLNMANLHVIPQAANTADLVLPSKLGGMLASGKPVIAMADRDTELGEFLGEDMIVVPPGDAEALAAAIACEHAAPKSYRHQAKALAAQLDSRAILKSFTAALFH